jgi:hypothetical protein
VAEVTAADPTAIALTLFGDYLFAFEVMGVLLLAAVIGGLYLARRDPDMPETNITAPSSDDDEESA